MHIFDDSDIGPIPQSMLKFLRHQVCPNLNSSLKKFYFSTTIRNNMDHLDRTAANTREKGLSVCTVSQLIDISPTVKKLRLIINTSNVSFKPGQWVDFFIPNLSTVGGFSICSSPTLLQEHSMIDLAVKESKHPPAAWIHNQCRIGSQVHIRIGGYFFLSKENSTRPLLLLAGGVGINPLLSMLLYVSEQKNTRTAAPVVLLYSTKTLEEQIFIDDIKAVIRDCPWIHLKQFITREHHVESGISNQRINADVIERTLQDYFAGHKDVISMLCGPSPFIDKMEEYLIKSGMKKEHVLYEKWW